MRLGDNLVKIFASCFRLLAKFNAGIKDGFFIDLISEESEKLLAGYIKFLKMGGGTIVWHNNVAQKDILQHQDVAKCRDIVQHDFHVAQYHLALIFQIKKLLNLLHIFNHLNLTKSTTPLLLERELLKLELLLLNYNKPFLTARAKTSRNLAVLTNKNPKKPVKPQELGMAHRQIAEFIRSKERVQNVEVFGQFTAITRRTLKRKLSELVKAGAIKRSALGKKVFYIATQSLAES